VGACEVKSGNYAILLEGSNVRVDQKTHSIKDCLIDTGSVIRIYSRTPTEQEADLLDPGRPAPVETKEMPEETKELVETEEPPAEEEVSEQILVPSEIEQAVVTANELSGDYGPILAVVMAGIAVMGGKKAWSFYSQKAEQRHEMEMKKLEMEQKSSNSDGQSPPACQAVHAKLEAEVSAMQKKVGLMEKRLLVMDDFDPEDLERKVKKLTKSVKSIREELEE
tara:strand:- start:4147 stop:4815 length:669 start_codon:yes stop_codon:yes gene_type:complete